MGYFNVVVLSLVLNFVSSPEKRGEMLKLASSLLSSGGLCYLILPSACLTNSRCISEEVMIHILKICGLKMLYSHYSRKLVLLECGKVGELGESVHLSLS